MARKVVKSPPTLPEFQARSEKQSQYLKAIRSNNLTFGIGPAGTGKTHVVARAAAEAICSGKFTKHIIIRPTISVEDEELGALPGDVDQKMDPWMRPILDELKMIVPFELLQKWPIECVPIAFIRGRNFANAFVHVTEAQNLTIKQCKAIVTRMCEDSKLVVEGDPEQSDLREGALERLIRIAKLMSEPFGLVRFEIDDVVRSERVKQWLKAFAAEQQYNNVH